MALGDSTTAHSKHDGVVLDGKNTGAAMSIQGHPSGMPGSNCCCINIYVNNNVQGVTNSVLFGSKVVMRDPRAKLSLRRRLGGCKVDGWRAKAGDVESVKAPVFWAMLLVLLSFVIFLVSWMWQCVTS
uniref:Uncharacterized protein LOC105043177 n=1 Tax=Elaeis guineensis var. tenera TaxID=51953 RepID=A0A6I9R7K6_ELAGV|nr:uncharacterized protein LOC105043177 [Elaeis guineensis]